MKSKRVAIWVIALFVVFGATMTAQAAGKVSLLEVIEGRIDKLTVLKGLIVNGVTQFNGTMLNTTKTNGADNPIAIGDNLRVDGEIFRGAKAGADTKPVKINDSLQVTGKVEAASIVQTSGDSLSHHKVYQGTIDTSAVGDFSKTVSTYASTYCTLTYVYQWKAITVPEITVAHMPSVEVFTDLSGTAMAGTAANYPDGANSWIKAAALSPFSGNQSFAEGKANVAYALDVVRTNCVANSIPTEVNGTVRTPMVGGNYKVVLDY